MCEHVWDLSVQMRAVFVVPPTTITRALSSADAEKAIPGSKQVLRRVTRRYDVEGNETIIVDYIRSAEGIREYRVRAGIDQNAPKFL